MQNSRVKLITPFLMLFAGAIASIIMYIKKYDFYTMLWVLLIVLVVFFVIGDVVRYLYTLVMPRVIPAADIEAIMANLEKQKEESMKAEAGEKERVEEVTAEEKISEEIEENETVPEEGAEADGDEAGWATDKDDEEEYTEENLDEM